MNHEAIVKTMTRRFDEIFDWAGLRVRELITKSYPDCLDTFIIDVGAGQGKYRILLADYPYMDAVEVFPPYVDDNHLRELYRHVHVSNVVNFLDEVSDEYLRFTIIIMGDILEHLTRSDAQAVLKRFRTHVDDIIVIVPYEYPQGEEDGNVHQAHLQDDLTPEIMAQVYPELTLVAGELRNEKPFKGIYRWRR